MEANSAQQGPHNHTQPYMEEKPLYYTETRQEVRTGRGGGGVAGRVIPDRDG
jgi:hypothetical protein